MDHDNETQFRTNVGTKDLKAPELDILTELRDGEQYTTAVDIWSIECILWWLCNDCVPFKNTGKILDFYRMERLDQNSIWFCDAGFPQKWPTGRLMQRLFVVDPLQRITASGALDLLQLQINQEMWCIYCTFCCNYCIRYGFWGRRKIGTVTAVSPWGFYVPYYTDVW